MKTNLHTVGTSESIRQEAPRNLSIPIVGGNVRQNLAPFGYMLFSASILNHKSSRDFGEMPLDQ